MLRFLLKKLVVTKEYDKNFFKQLDILENNVLDGQSFDETAQNDNLKVIKLKKLI